MQRRLVAAFSGLLLLTACGTSSETGTAGDTTRPTTSTAGQSQGNVSTAVGQYRPGSQEELANTIGDRVFFDFDRHDLNGEGRQQVQGWAGWLRQYPNVTATVEGHADERGTREYNLALGERRANSIRDYLTAQGVAGSRLRTISYGKERPAVLGSSEQSWAQNRRGVLTVD